MGNVDIFAKAFRECGIGGKYSKFRVAQIREFFELMNVEGDLDSPYCFKVYDRVDHRKFRQVTSGEASQLYRDDPDWTSHFQTAQKVVAKIVSRDGKREDNRYYIDDVHKSVYVINRMFVIEVSPTLRQAPDVTTTALFEFLSTYVKGELDCNAVVKVHERFGDVCVTYADRQYLSLLTVDEFNDQFGEAA